MRGMVEFFAGSEENEILAFCVDLFCILSESDLIGFCINVSSPNFAVSSTRFCGINKLGSGLLTFNLSDSLDTPRSSSMALIAGLVTSSFGSETLPSGSACLVGNLIISSFLNWEDLHNTPFWQLCMLSLCSNFTDLIASFTSLSNFTETSLREKPNFFEVRFFLFFLLTNGEEDNFLDFNFCFLSDFLLLVGFITFFDTGLLDLLILDAVNFSLLNLNESS